MCTQSVSWMSNRQRSIHYIQNDEGLLSDAAGCVLVLGGYRLC